jgi:hypothetical protein
MIRLSFPALFLLLVAGCSSEGGGAADTAADEIKKTTYVDAGDYWRTEADQNAWFALRQKLVHEFDNVCGDTFCGGDYSNLTSLGFTCAVSSVRGAVHECVWTFAGSSHLVNAATGTVNATVATFHCRVAPKTSARALLATLGGEGAAKDDAIHRTLPGSTQSLYDVLGDCFQHPVGATPISQGTGTTYVDAIDSYDAGTNVDAFFDASQALRAGFDNVCGDTFCGGDYTNLESLRLACSVRGTTGTIRSCKWFLAGSDSTTGAITVHPKTYQCMLPARGTANDLSSVLNAPSPNGDEMLRRPLPGSTKSAYDVLTTCL